MTTVKGYRDTLTPGTSMGEEGIGYGFGELDSYGDYSRATHGHLQESTEPVTFRLLVPGAYVARSEGGEMLLYAAKETPFVVKEYGRLPFNQGLSTTLALA